MAEEYFIGENILVTKKNDDFKTEGQGIVPNTKRYQDKKALDKEKQLKEEELEKEKQTKEEEQNLKKLQFLREQQKRKEKEQQEKLEIERLKMEEEEEIKTLKGQFGQMINALKSNKTPLEYSISGISLLPTQIRILALAASNNESLQALTMSRKNIVDKEIIEIIKIIKKNKSLLKLDLEGNEFGPKGAKAVASLIEENSYLRNLNISNNNLTDFTMDNTGVSAIAKALKVNKTLLCLQMTNTNLGAVDGKNLKEAMHYNKTIIDLNVLGNREMNLFDVREIQDILVENKKDYDLERYKEFMERRRLNKEEEIGNKLERDKSSQEVAKFIVNQRIDDAKFNLERDWQKQLLDEEIEKQKLIQKLEKSKPKTKGKRGAKKKG